MTIDLITIELARLVETGTEWERRFRRYDLLIDAGLSCEEAAEIIMAGEISTRAELEEAA